MPTGITNAELKELQRAKKEELVAEFHTWLQCHFDDDEEVYVNSIVTSVDDDKFCQIAESWADDKKRNKLFY